MDIGIKLLRYILRIIKIYLEYEVFCMAYRTFTLLSQSKVKSSPYVSFIHPSIHLPTLYLPTPPKLDTIILMDDSKCYLLKKVCSV